jgi:hypothetical protein
VISSNLKIRPASRYLSWSKTCIREIVMGFFYGLIDILSSVGQQPYALQTQESCSICDDNFC